MVKEAEKYAVLLSEPYEKLQMRIYIMKRILRDFADYPPFAKEKEAYQLGIEILEGAIFEKEFDESASYLTNNDEAV